MMERPSCLSIIDPRDVKQNSIRKQSGQILTSVSSADVLLHPQVELELEHVFKHASS